MPSNRIQLSIRKLAVESRLRPVSLAASLSPTVAAGATMRQIVISASGIALRYAVTSSFPPIIRASTSRSTPWSL